MYVRSCCQIIFYFIFTLECVSNTKCSVMKLDERFWILNDLRFVETETDTFDDRKSICQIESDALFKCEIFYKL